MPNFDEVSELVQHVSSTAYNTAFCCLGSQVHLGDDVFKKIDYTYVVNFAEAAHESKIPHFSLISSGGADASSMFLYLRVKGQADAKIAETGFSSASIWRPGMLDRGDMARTKEKIGSFLGILN